MADPLFNKTWKMDAGKSLFTAGFNPVQETRLYEERPNGYKLTVSGAAGGSEYTWWYEAFHDGKFYPVHGRDDVDAIQIFKLNDTQTCGFFTKGPNNMPGGPYSRKLDVVNSILTVEAAGRRPDGSAFYDVIKYQL